MTEKVGSKTRVTSYSYDALNRLSGERSGSKHAVYVRDPWGTLLLQRSWTTEAALRRDAGATSSAYADHRFLLDGVGSVVGLADADAALVASFSYDPFGQLIESTGEADLTPFRFTSAYADPTGLLKMGERYYDPSLGRFTQQDPIYDPLDPKLWNRYVYVGNDPINFVDPSGLSAWDYFKCWAKQLNPFDVTSAGTGALGGAAVVGSSGGSLLAYIAQTGGITSGGAAAAAVTGYVLIAIGAGLMVYVGVGIHRKCQKEW